MRKRLGLLAIECDAPPYKVVQACAGIGFRAPEDMRWLRKHHFVDRASGLRTFPGGKGPRPNATCSCGQEVPDLVKYLFVFSTGEEFVYCFGQCARCGTMFWEQES